MATVPAPVMPAPMTAVPAPVAVMAMPVHLFGRKLAGFLAGGDGRMSVGIALRHARGIADRLRRQWRGLRGRGKDGGARRHTQCKFQKVPALHDMSSRLPGK